MFVNEIDLNLLFEDDFSIFVFFVNDFDLSPSCVFSSSVEHWLDSLINKEHLEKQLKHK
jgi:hypothetical protein